MPDIIQQAYARAEQLDARGFAAFCTEDAKLFLANNPPAVGRAAIEESLHQLFTKLSGIRHERIGRWGDANTVVLESIEHYTRKSDGQVISLGSATVAHLRKGKLAELRIYVDLAPLFSPGRAHTKEEDSSTHSEQSDLVDLASEQSFPASDPPSSRVRIGPTTNEQGNPQKRPAGL